MNQNTEQIARDNIDKQLLLCGWGIQEKKQIKLSAEIGVAIRKYQTETGPAEYILFVDKKTVRVIEAKRDDEGFKLIVAEGQSTEYANSELKYLNNAPLPSAPDKTSSDITWLKDKSLADLDKLSDPDILANDILENFRSSIRQLK